VPSRTKCLKLEILKICYKGWHHWWLVQAKQLSCSKHSGFISRCQTLTQLDYKAKHNSVA
jgi:hypothetical protein